MPNSKSYIPPEAKKVPDRFEIKAVERFQNTAHANILKVGTVVEEKFKKDLEESNAELIELARKETAMKLNAAEDEKIEQARLKFEQEKLCAIEQLKREHEIHLKNVQIQTKELERVHFNKVLALEREAAEAQLKMQEERLRAKFEQQLQKEIENVTKAERARAAQQNQDVMATIQAELKKQKEMLEEQFERQMRDREDIFELKMQKVTDELAAQWKKNCDAALAKMEAGFMKDLEDRDDKIEVLELSNHHMSQAIRVLNERIEGKNEKIMKLRQSFCMYIKASGKFSDEQADFMIPRDLTHYIESEVIAKEDHVETDDESPEHSF